MSGMFVKDNYVDNHAFHLAMFDCMSFKKLGKHHINMIPVLLLCF